MLLYLKRNCLDDGPGIRTTAFFKGCPLSCEWCHNPESKKAFPELSYDASRCMQCGECSKTCRRKAIGPEKPGFVDRVKCDACGGCVPACPSGALNALGREPVLGEIVATLKRDIPFFRNSGGGLTLSGGEPTLYMDFCSALLQECRRLEINALLETSAHFDFKKFAFSMLPCLDIIYVDIKLIDPAAHARRCGVPNDKILANLRRLGKLSAGGEIIVLPRIPLAPGITDQPENLSGIASFLKECGFRKVALLPYNPTWLNKPAMVGAPAVYTEDKWMSAEDLERCRVYFKEFEIESSGKTK